MTLVRNVEIKRNHLYPGEPLDCVITINDVSGPIDWLVAQVYGFISFDDPLSESVLAELSIPIHGSSLLGAQAAKQYIPVQHRLPENTGLLLLFAPEVISCGLVSERAFFYKPSIPEHIMPSYSGKSFRVFYGVSIGGMLQGAAGGEYSDHTFKILSVPSRTNFSTKAVSFVPLVGCGWQSVEERRLEFVSMFSELEKEDERLFDIQAEKGVRVVCLRVPGRWIGDMFQVTIKDTPIVVDMFADFAEKDIDTDSLVLEVIRSETAIQTHSVLLWRFDFLETRNLLKGPLSFYVPVTAAGFKSNVVSLQYSLRMTFKFKNQTSIEWSLPFQIESCTHSPISSDDHWIAPKDEEYVKVFGSVVHPL